jgi:hypothetical protein
MPSLVARDESAPREAVVCVGGVVVALLAQSPWQRLTGERHRSKKGVRRAQQRVGRRTYTGTR